MFSLKSKKYYNICLMKKRIKLKISDSFKQKLEGTLEVNNK